MNIVLGCTAYGDAILATTQLNSSAGRASRDLVMISSQMEVIDRKYGLDSRKKLRVDVLRGKVCFVRKNVGILQTNSGILLKMEELTTKLIINIEECETCAG